MINPGSLSSGSIALDEGEKTTAPKLEAVHNRGGRMNQSSFLSDVCFWLPEHVTYPFGWVGHIPFAFWIMEASRPEVFVELGTHSGNSYFAFCQAVKNSIFRLGATRSIVGKVTSTRASTAKKSSNVSTRRIVASTPRSLASSARDLTRPLRSLSRNLSTCCISTVCTPTRPSSTTSSSGCRRCRDAGSS